MNTNEQLTNPLDTIRLKLQQYLYMVLVVILSMTAMIVFPLFGGGNDTPGLNLPTTTAEWVVYLTVRICISFINVMIYLCFVKQGETNSLEHPNKIEADKILYKHKIKEFVPRSPKQFKSSKYGGKSIGILTSSLLALIALPPIVAYNWQMALTYLFTIVISIVFGLYQMKDAEAYWCYEYLRYAKYMEDEINNV